MLVRDATLPDGRRVDIRIEGERIDAIEPGLEGDPVIEAGGALVLPGAIDVHVHFREPGAPHKETWATGTQAAAAGGVTTVVDQPNTDPPTVDRASFRLKVAATEPAIVDFGINGGVTDSWNPRELFDEPITALGEVFMADSTGDLGIGRDTFEAAVAEAAEHDVLLTVHAEDASLFDEDVRDRRDADAWSAYRTAEAEIAAVEAACEIADAYDARLHIAHTSTPEAIDIATSYGATCEVCPHHLLLSRADLDSLGTFGRMNPPLRSEDRRAAVFERVRDGRVTMIATDHAPHTRKEKDTDIWSAPSGVPGVETMLPLLLSEVVDERLTLERVVDLVARHPAERFGLDRKGRIAVGTDADLVLVDIDRTRSISPHNLVTACGWTPFEGMTGIFPSLTILRGEIAYRNPDTSLGLPSSLDDSVFGPSRGQNVRT